METASELVRIYFAGHGGRIPRSVSSAWTRSQIIFLSGLRQTRTIVSLSLATNSVPIDSPNSWRRHMMTSHFSANGSSQKCSTISCLFMAVNLLRQLRRAI